MKKWEISLLIAVVAAIVCCAALPETAPQWWTAAFSPLCDGMLTANAEGADVVLRSRLWELLTGAVS